MSLRLRLFLIFGGLMVAQSLAQWWLVNTMTRDLSREVGSVAFDVGKRLVTAFWVGPQADETDVRFEAGHATPVVEAVSDGKSIVYRFESKGNSRHEFPRDMVIDHVVKIKTDSDETQPWPEREDRQKFYYHNKPLTGQTGQTGVFIVEVQHSDTLPPEKIKQALRDFGLKEDIVVEVVDKTQKQTTTDTKPGAPSDTALQTTTRQQDGVTIQSTVISNKTAPGLHEEVLRNKLREIGLKGDVAFRKISTTTSAMKNAGRETVWVSLDNPGTADYVVMEGDSSLKKIPIPKSGIADSISRLSNNLLLGSGGMLLIGLLVVAAASHRFTRPLRKLAFAAEQIGEGRLGVQVVGQKPVGEVGVAIREFNNMSQRLQAWDERERGLRRREHLSELGEISRGLAHTIRNPLNTLGLAIDQMAALNPENQTQQELTQTARGQIRRIDQWIRSFLVLSSQEAATREPIDFRGIVQDVVLEAIQDGHGNIPVQAEIADDLPVMLGIKPEIRAAIQALVVNAVQASPPNGTVNVTVTSDSRQTIQLIVEDEGAGIPDQIRDKLFTPHVTTKAQGSGMGLFLAHRVITSRYQGSINLSDRQPTGTRAEITIPFQKGGAEHG